MRYAVLVASLGLAAFFVPADGARASVTFIGPGSAYDCYMAAEYGQVRPGETALDICNTAMNDPIAGRELAGTLVNRSIIYVRMGNADMALKDCEDALKIMPTMGEAHANLGVALLRIGRLQDAMTALDKGIEYGVNKPYAAYYDRGLVREDLGDVKGAYVDYKKAVDIKPDFELAQEQLKRFTIMAQSGPQLVSKNTVPVKKTTTAP
jgi:tetratricopeptide (TPR) repeat protein